MTLEHLLIFGPVMIVTWFLVTYFWSSMLLYVFKRAILARGVGNGPIPINTLQAVPQELFADPLHPRVSASPLVTRGVNRDTLYVVGWLDLSKASLVLHVPDMAGRYYSVQFTDPSKNTNFAYVGKRTTGTQVGDYLITGPTWTEQVPRGMQQIPSPNTSVLVVGRVFVESDSDLPTAHDLAEQRRIRPLLSSSVA